MRRGKVLRTYETMREDARTHKGHVGRHGFPRLALLSLILSFLYFLFLSLTHFYDRCSFRSCLFSRYSLLAPLLCVFDFDHLSSDEDAFMHVLRSLARLTPFVLRPRTPCALPSSLALLSQLWPLFKKLWSAWHRLAS